MEINFSCFHAMPHWRPLLYTVVIISFTLVLHLICACEMHSKQCEQFFFHLAFRHCIIIGLGFHFIPFELKCSRTLRGSMLRNKMQMPMVTARIAIPFPAKRCSSLVHDKLQTFLIWWSWGKSFKKLFSQSSLLVKPESCRSSTG